MRPAFPTLTFPNHWTLLTGLYPSSHGIVANDFYDPAISKEFVYTEPGQSWDAEWWGGEPIWATAVKNSLRSAVLMWPGPPMLQDDTKPSLWYPFVNHFNYHKKVDRVEKWLGTSEPHPEWKPTVDQRLTCPPMCADMSYSQRPHLMTVYAPEVDQAGHKSGPHSHNVDKTLRAMDKFVKDVFDAIDRRNLTEIVDVIVVSDHGMAGESSLSSPRPTGSLPNELSLRGQQRATTASSSLTTSSALKALPRSRTTRVSRSGRAG